MTSAGGDRPAEFDLLIIGGGVNGAGIARDAALRGMRVCLLEQGDLCHGTSRWSSRLIHGGLRYLEHAEFDLVRESLRERETLMRIAPQLVRPLPMLVPVYAGARRGRFTIGAGLWLYDLLSLNKSLPRHKMLSRDETRELLPGLAADGLKGAARYYDAQVRFPERLVVENALAAAAAGAELRTYHRVERIGVDAGRVTGLSCMNLRSGDRVDMRGRMVVNAAGPWVDEVLNGLGSARVAPELMGGTKGSHIVVHAFDGAPQLACYAEARSDGRPYFVLPWNGLFLIGTTDIRTSGDPDDAALDPAELDYLLTETNRLFPDARLNDRSVLYHYTGVRPLPRQADGAAGAITRRHALHEHAPACAGLYSVIGGKLTTYRSLAEEVVDRLALSDRGGLSACTTGTVKLPGAQRPLAEVAEELAACQTLSADSRRHLLNVYGSRATEIAARIRQWPELGAELDSWSHAVAAEIPFAFEQEFAVSLADVLYRRCMAGLSPDLGRSALDPAIEVASECFGWDDARRAQEREQCIAEMQRLRSSLD